MKMENYHSIIKSGQYSNFSYCIGIPKNPKVYPVKSFAAIAKADEASIRASPAIEGEDIIHAIARKTMAMEKPIAREDSWIMSVLRFNEAAPGKSGML